MARTMQTAAHALDAAFERFQIATCLIAEGDRTSAEQELMNALRDMDGMRDDEIYDDVQSLLRSLRAA